MNTFDPVSAAVSDTAALTLRAARERVGDDEPRAWVSLANEALLALWRPAPSGSLTGLSFGVKDIIDLAGMPTRCGSAITPAAPATQSAPFVQTLIEAGAVPVGKTVTTEFAYFSPGPTQNPRVPGHTPGGSSSGSAAAVAAGHVEFAIGSQTAGSLTRPAAYCGVTGLVFTRGAQPTSGFSGLADSLDAPGVVAADLGVLARVAAAVGVTAPPAPVAHAYVWTGQDLDDVSSGMRAAVASTAKGLADLGVTIASLPARHAIAQLAADHLVIMAYEVARQRPDLARRRKDLSPQLSALITEGLRLRAGDYRPAKARTDAADARLADLLGDDGVIIGPGAPGPAPAGLAATGSPIMSRPWQLLGRPQLCLPGHATRRGRPLGVQLIGAKGAETTLIALAQRWGEQRAVHGA